MPLDGLPDPCPRGSQCAGSACRLLRPTEGTFPRVAWGLVWRTRPWGTAAAHVAVRETRVNHAPCRGGTGAGSLGPSLLFPIWLTQPFTSHHFTHFVIFLVSFIFSSFFILSSLPFKIFPCLLKCHPYFCCYCLKSIKYLHLSKGNIADVESTVSSFAWGTFFVNYFPILASYYAHHKTLRLG